MSDNFLCVCGHSRESHQHYRAGSDCAICGAAICPRFRRRRFWRKNLSTS